MATTIAPAIGAGALFTQQGVGTSPGYSAIDLRRSDSLGLQEGVYGASDFMVVQRAASANMSVDITMPTGGFACVQGDSVSGQGLYTVPTHSAPVNEAIAAADATNPRIDTVILEVLDNVHDASGSSLARVRVLTGTPFAGTNLASRAGAATLPGNALLLADVLVGNGVSTIPNTVIRDRRKWARGAGSTVERTAGNLTSTLTTFAQLSAGFQVRLELAGVPTVARLVGFARHATDAQFVAFSIRDNSVAVGPIAIHSVSGANGNVSGVLAEYKWTPAAGSHVLEPFWRSSDGGTVTLTAQATSEAGLAGPAYWIVEEQSRQNSANNSVTSG